MSLFRKKAESPSEWYNPKPDSIGEIVAELKTANDKFKSLVIKTKENSYCVYLYECDKSDIDAGMSHALGWIGQCGPSYTDTLERAKELAAESISNYEGNR